MSKYRGPRVRIIRRLGDLPGFTRKFFLEFNSYPPGQHGSRKKKQKVSDYNIRLMEKQKLRYNYGLTEKQLVNYIRKARKKKGSTGFYLMRLLEMRLDSIVFRFGLGPTIPTSRQIINHGHIYVNNICVNIPSFQCKPGDIITTRKKLSTKKLIKNNMEESSFSFLPSHLKYHKNNSQMEILDFIKKENLSFKINELLIVEYYSRIF